MPNRIATHAELQAPTVDRDYNRSRAERQRFYNSPAWRTLRTQVLREQPVCARCRRRPSSVVHHIEDRIDRPDLELARENLEGQCAVCHNHHTATTTRQKSPGGAVKCHRMA